nr:hypothetical protein Itr_chr09CG12560 [Ipomoea trifida]
MTWIFIVLPVPDTITNHAKCEPRNPTMRNRARLTTGLFESIIRVTEPVRGGARENLKDGAESDDDSCDQNLHSFPTFPVANLHPIFGSSCSFDQPTNAISPGGAEQF